MKGVLYILSLLMLSTGCDRKPITENPPPAPTEIVTDTVIKRTMPKANNSLAYLGLYKGTLPCAGCRGIEMTLELAEDFTYSMTKKEVGKKSNPSEHKGTYSWKKDGKAIILDNIKESPNQYLVGEKMLTQLDAEGNIVAGKSSSEYILRKMTEAESQKTDAPKSESK